MVRENERLIETSTHGAARRRFRNKEGLERSTLRLVREGLTNAASTRQLRPNTAATCNLRDEQASKPRLRYGPRQWLGNPRRPFVAE